MTYRERVAERQGQIARHYARGGLGETAPRPLCECCADKGWIFDHRPTWNQADERGGHLDAELVSVPCPVCPLGKEEAAPVCETEAA